MSVIHVGALFGNEETLSVCILWNEYQNKILIIYFIKVFIG